MGDAIGFRQQLNTSFGAFELEIAVNYPVHTYEVWQFHAKSHELIDAFLAEKIGKQRNGGTVENTVPPFA